MEKTLLERFQKKCISMKVKSKEFRIEKAINRRDDKLYVTLKGYDNSFNCRIYKKAISLYEISYLPEPHTRSKNKVKVELDLSNYPTKYDLN